MLTILEPIENELIINKSSFITYLYPVQTVDEAKNYIKQIKEKHPTATHHVVCYIIGKTGENGTANDDGEPSGTAGRPMLEVLLGSEIRGIAAVVTRYFGGTLLGTGGLVRAYSKAVQEGLAQSMVIEKQYGAIISIGTDYTGIGKIQYFIGERKIPVLESEYTDKVQLKVIMPVGEVKRFLADLTEATNGRAKLEISENLYYAVLDGMVLMGEDLKGE
jgi:uncharacterized YigZ family protein